MAKKKTVCPTCGGVTSEYIFKFDSLDAALILAMARMVKDKLSWARSFTDANKIHVPTLNASLAIRCRTTQCSKLGLVAKFKENGKHTPGMWVITARGFAAIRGEAVPSEVSVFRKNIVERPGLLTTMREAKGLVGYKPEDWYHFGDQRVSTGSNQLF